MLFEPNFLNAEFLAYQYMNNLTNAERIKYESLQIFGRKTLATIILSLAIPWGIMPVFVPFSPGNYTPLEKYGEFRSVALMQPFVRVCMLILLVGVTVLVIISMGTNSTLSYPR
jgi:hypothetical protein